jgi:HSP20 family molecular chaperone IbpA
MWADACDLLSQADRLHRQFFRLAERGHAQPQWEPPVDMVEFADGVLVTVALPGVRTEDVRISLSAETGSVLISAQRLGPANLRTGDAAMRSRTVIRRLEIPYGRFERRIALPVGR